MGKRWRWWQKMTTLGVFLGLAACGLWRSSIPTRLPLPSVTPPPMATATRPSMAPATVTPPTVPSPTSTPTARPCVPVTPQPLQGTPPSFAALLQGAGVAALNAGMAPDELNARLQEAGMGGYPRAVYIGRINDDRWTDALLVLVDPHAKTNPPAGALQVALGGPDGFCVAQTLRAEKETFAGLVVHAVADLDADGRLEAVIGWTQCDKVTCTERLQVLAWRQGRFSNLLAGSPEFADPWVEIQPPEEQPPEGQKRYRVAVHAEGVPGGTGPARAYTRFYAYDPASDTWRLAETQWAPPKTRIHLLHDADRAARQGNLMQALVLYGQVVASQEVRDEALPNAGEPARLRAVLAAYARFRMLVLHARAGRQAIAQATYAELRQAVDDDPALQPYFEMATAFWQAYQQAGWDAACEAARRYAAEHAQAVLAPLGPQVYGTNNRAYTPEDVCLGGKESP